MLAIMAAAATSSTSDLMSTSIACGVQI